jgi:flagella basal body P-ring formation protein FlgA
MKNAFLLIAGICALLPVQLRAVVLELRATQTATGDNITLNDVIQSSQGASSDDLTSVITTAPSLGKEQTWTRDQIEKILPASLKQQTIEWSGAATCVISRPALQYSPREVRDLITAELSRRLPADSDFAILETPGLDAFLIPTGPVDAKVELGAATLRNEWADAMLKFSAQGQVVVTQNVRFHWAYTRKVWQVSAPVALKEELAPGSFQQIEVNVLKVPGQLDPTTDFPDGKVAAHPLPVGKILMGNDWIDPVLVSRNDLVTILYDHHGVSITVQAKAMANGVRNEVIAVQNVTSHKIFNARVVDERSLVYDE